MTYNIIVVYMLIIVFIIASIKGKEGFGSCVEDVFGFVKCYYPLIIDPNLFFGSATRYTRNMSYDIRGDPIIIPYRQFVWNTGTIRPTYYYPQRL